MQNAKCKMQNTECKTDDKPRAEGKLACAMPRCEGGKAYEVGLMQNLAQQIGEMGPMGQIRPMGALANASPIIVPLVLLVSLVSYLLRPLSTLNSQLLTNMECLGNCICR